MRKKLSLILVICILFSSSSLGVKAEKAGMTEVELISAPEEANVISAPNVDVSVENLEKMTSAIKKKITIPTNLTNFDYQYNSNGVNSRAYWELIWSNQDETERLIVISDGDANITSYNHYSKDQYKRNKPVYLKSELKSKADQFIKKAASSLYKKVSFKNTNYNGLYSGHYSYHYIRMENKIPMPDNGITVSINYETGQVVSASIDWLYVTIPSPDAAITKEAAAQKMEKNLNMVLAYKDPYDILDGKTKNSAFLVYQPDKDYVSVDAKTGKVYQTREEWILDSDTKYENATETAMDKEKSDGANLTEKEISSIEKINSLITKEKAIKAITSEESLLIDSKATAISANLMQTSSSYDNKKSYVWNITFEDPRPVEDDKDSYRAYANASVDAKTGKILSFYGSVPNYYDIDEAKWKEVNVKYNSKSGRAIFESFIKGQIPSYYNKSKFSDSKQDYIIAYKEDSPIYGGYRYHYDRVNEDVTYPYNGINGSVDGVTGKIYQYNYNWNEGLSFESTKNAMSPDKAFDHYIENDGLQLIYEINTIHNEKDAPIGIYDSKTYLAKSEVRLVYRADITPNTISPFTGKQLDENGEVYTGESSYSYTDISSYPARNAIDLLADMGVGFEGKEYLPNQNITTKEFESFLSKLEYNMEEWTRKDNSSITRMDAVKTLIRLAGLDKVATLKNIYTTDLKDHNKISKDDIGYVALAKGLGIVSGHTFRPEEALTRGEAAQMIVNLLKADIE